MLKAVEGDASLTRSDAFIGDNRNFNQTLWDMVWSPCELANDSSTHMYLPGLGTARCIRRRRARWPENSIQPAVADRNQKAELRV